LKKAAAKPATTSASAQSYPKEQHDQEALTWSVPAAPAPATDFVPIFAPSYAPAFSSRTKETAAAKGSQWAPRAQKFNEATKEAGGTNTFAFTPAFAASYAPSFFSSTRSEKPSTASSAMTSSSVHADAPVDVAARDNEETSASQISGFAEVPNQSIYGDDGSWGAEVLRHYKETRQDPDFYQEEPDLSHLFAPAYASAFDNPALKEAAAKIQAEAMQAPDTPAQSSEGGSSTAETSARRQKDAKEVEQSLRNFMVAKTSSKADNSKTGFTPLFAPGKYAPAAHLVQAPPTISYGFGLLAATFIGISGIAFAVLRFRRRSSSAFKNPLLNAETSVV
jgi:hypothetical protein